MLRRAEGKPRTYGAGHDNEKRAEDTEEEERNVRRYMYNVRDDGDVPKVAATDFTNDNNGICEVSTPYF